MHHHILMATKDKTFLQGMDAIMSSIYRPEGSLEGVGYHFATFFVPNFLRQPLRNTDPLKRDYKLSSMLYKTFPSSELALPDLDFYGRDIEKGGNAVTRLALPVGQKTGVPKLTDQMLDRWNKENPDEAYAPRESRIETYKDPATGDRVKMTPEQQRRFEVAYKAETDALLSATVSRGDAANPTAEKVEEAEKIIKYTPSRVRKRLFELPPVASGR